MSGCRLSLGTFPTPVEVRYQQVIHYVQDILGYMFCLHLAVTSNLWIIGKFWYWVRSLIFRVSLHCPFHCVISGKNRTVELHGVRVLVCAALVEKPQTIFQIDFINSQSYQQSQTVPLSLHSQQCLVWSVKKSQPFYWISSGMAFWLYLHCCKLVCVLDTLFWHRGCQNKKVKEMWTLHLDRE